MIAKYAFKKTAGSTGLEYLEQFNIAKQIVLDVLRASWEPQGAPRRELPEGSLQEA